MASNLWTLYPPSWWPKGWWPFKSGPVSSAPVFLFNGVQLKARLPAEVGDVYVDINGVLYGIPVVAATDTPSGAIRIRVNGTVKALERA